MEKLKIYQARTGYPVGSGANLSNYLSDVNGIQLQTDPRAVICWGNASTPHPKVYQVNQNIEIHADSSGSEDTVTTTGLGAPKWLLTQINFV